MVVVAEGYLAILDGHLEAHGPVREFGQGFGAVAGQVKDGEVVETLQLAMMFVPPDGESPIAIGVQDHFAGAVTGLSQSILFWQPQLNPHFNLAGQVFLPKLGFVIGAQPLGEFQGLAGVQGKGEQPDHHSLVGF